MNKLISGTEYRALETGYVLRRGKREVYINAKRITDLQDPKKSLVQAI